jgi:hypothetical protein
MEEDGDPLLRLDKLYRMDTISRLNWVKMKKSLAVAKKEGADVPNLGHFVFRGAPGKCALVAK